MSLCRHNEFWWRLLLSGGIFVGSFGVFISGGCATCGALSIFGWSIACLAIAASVSLTSFNSSGALGSFVSGSLSSSLAETVMVRFLLAEL